MEDVRKFLQKKADPSRAAIYQRFFKTLPGQYGEGDVFIGVVVPEVNKIAKIFYKDINLKEIHEERLCALKILVLKYEKGDEKEKRQIVKFYLANRKFVNNWDLVDTSAHYILGNYLYNFDNKNIEILKKLATSKNLWDRRISIIACFYFIYHKESKQLLQIAELVKNDKHDLMHKALGWMLREVYKRADESVVRKFLEKNIKLLPRTTLRYAIEKMDLSERKIWLAKK